MDTLTDILSNFFVSSSKKNKSNKRTMIWNTPKILIIQLKRLIKFIKSFIMCKSC